VWVNNRQNNSASPSLVKSPMTDLAFCNIIFLSCKYSGQLRSTCCSDSTTPQSNGQRRWDSCNPSIRPVSSVIGAKPHQHFAKADLCELN